ncbi:unnamed protein product [Merluccius merluccius]
MSGGDVRVLRQEAGQESPRMPAWKREILERRKAKGSGGSGAAGAGGPAEAGPSNGGSQRVNGTEVPGGDGGPKTDNGTSAASGSGSGSGRSYAIANQHFGGKRGAPASPPDLSPSKTNKDPPWASSLSAADHRDPAEIDGRGPESLVLHDSLGPLQENPFIKLEKERKRRQDLDNAARPVQHILELYGSVPGIRTIRADNIIIIESDPDYFLTEAGSDPVQQNGVGGYSSLNDLLDRRGSAVTEIRAREVVIYDTALSKSEENLSTLGRSDYDRQAYDTAEGQGRVSRMLQKFDSNYGKLQKKSHSTENLLDLDSSPGSRHRLRPKPQPDLVPKPYAVRPQPGLPVRHLGKTHSLASFQIGGHQSSRPEPAAVSVKDVPLGPPLLGPSPLGPPPSVSSFRQRFEDSGTEVNHQDETSGAPPLPRPAKERDWDSLGESFHKPKVPRSPDTRRAAGAESPTGTASPKAHRSSGFEIRPSPIPDLSLIPEGDLQARALANLRLQSRKSFTVIPIRHNPLPPSVPASSFPKSPPVQRAAEVPRVPTAHVPTPVTPPKRQEEEEVVDRSVSPSPKHTTTTSPSPPLLVPTSPPIPSSPPPAPSPVPSVPDPAPGDPSATATITGELLPVTNIDDFEVEHHHHHPAPSPMIQKRKGNTFTVVPNRKAESQSPTTTTTNSLEAPLEPSSSAGGQPGSTAPATTQAPYSHLGSQLKKRYPAVEEIEVIGGYLSLGKSCLAKTGSAGKKISFNEAGLHSTYEYPSESSAWDSDGEDDEEVGNGTGVADDQPSMVGRIHIPRPSFTSSPSHGTNSNDLSNYIPKHSVDFNAWQEHKMDEPVLLRDANAQQTQISEEVMLTPADSNSLSDYSSEPALYF